MKIALIAHDAKKNLIQNFCVAYFYILSKHSICSTATTGHSIEKVTNLSVHKYLAGHLGGEKQLGAEIENNQIDLVIFLRDPRSKKLTEPDEDYIFRLCDLHSIPLATNIAMAEILIKALHRGDLAWREIQHQ